MRHHQLYIVSLGIEESEILRKNKYRKLSAWWRNEYLRVYYFVAFCCGKGNLYFVIKGFLYQHTDIKKSFRLPFFIIIITDEIKHNALTHGARREKPIICSRKTINHSNFFSLSRSLTLPLSLPSTYCVGD